MRLWQQTASFTRPADTTAYADEDLVANSTTAGSVVPMSFYIPLSREVRLTNVRLLKSGATATNATFSLYLFKDSPTVTNGDNGAFAPTESNLCGVVAVDLAGSKGSDDASHVVAADIRFITDIDQTIYGLLKAEAAYTPASAEVFTVTLIGEAYA